MKYCLLKYRFKILFTTMNKQVCFVLQVNASLSENWSLYDNCMLSSTRI